jgi:hypothetical protein
VPLELARLPGAVEVAWAKPGLDVLAAYGEVVVDGFAGKLEAVAEVEYGFAELEAAVPLFVVLQPAKPANVKTASA